jgi:hypothetical protein
MKAGAQPRAAREKEKGQAEQTTWPLGKAIRRRTTENYFE